MCLNSEVLEKNQSYMFQFVIYVLWIIILQSKVLITKNFRFGVATPQVETDRRPGISYHIFV